MPANWNYSALERNEQAKLSRAPKTEEKGQVNREERIPKIGDFVYWTSGRCSSNGIFMVFADDGEYHCGLIIDEHKNGFLIKGYDRLVDKRRVSLLPYDVGGTDA